MTTLRYKLFETALKLTGAPRMIEKGLVRGETLSDGPKGKLRARWVRSEFQGRDVWTCAPKSEASGRIYVHLHGGAYVLGLNGLHYETMTKLADRSGATIIMPDYPLPPKVLAEGVIEWAAAHWASVVAEYGQENVGLGGDSAGGNLALAVAQREPVHAPILLLSPLVDLNLSNDTAEDSLLLDLETLQRASNRYAGELPLDDTRLSPINADPKDLPTVCIFTGELDLLHPQILRFAEKMKSAGKLHKLATYGEFGHYWMFYPVPDRESTLVELAAMIGR